MKTTTPEISWHSCCALYSVDFCTKLHPNIESDGQVYFMMATGGVDSLVGIWLISSNPTGGKNSIIFLSYLEKHVGGVNVVRFSACGNFLATGGDDGNLIVWEINPQITVNIEQMDSLTNSDDIWSFKCVLRGHIDAIYDICWSNDSTMLCSGSIDNNCILWSVEKRKYLHIFSDNKSYVQGLAWSPNPIHFKKKGITQAILCHCADGSAKMYAVSTKKVAQRISRYIDASAFHNDKKNSADENEEETRKPCNFQIFSDDLHGSFYRRCSFSPDGRFFVLTSGVITNNFKAYIDANSCMNKPIRVAFLYSTLIPSTPLTYYFSSDSTSCISVKFSPKVYQLRENVTNLNTYTQHLNYRMLFAILAMDTLVIFDTQSLDPIGYVRNTHLSSHTDISWFPDGNGIVFTSTDGYCTICEFSASEIGIEIDLPEVDTHEQMMDENEVDDGISVNNGSCLMDSFGNPNDEDEPSLLEQDAAKFFPADQISVRISNCCPEDIKIKSNTDSNVSNSKPKRVSFVTISKPSDN